MKRPRVMAGPAAWISAGVLLLVFGLAPLAHMIVAERPLLAGTWALLVAGFLALLWHERFLAAALCAPFAVIVLLRGMD
jgi:hypothetical protein